MAEEITNETIIDNKSVNKSKILIFSPDIHLQAYLEITGTKLNILERILRFPEKGLTEFSAQVKQLPI